MFFRNFFRLCVIKKSNAYFRRCCHLTHARSTLNFSWFQPPAAGGGGCLPMSFFIFDLIIFALIHRPHCWSWTFLQCVVVWPCEPMHEPWNLQPGVKWWSEGRSSSPFEIHWGSCPQYLGNGLSKSKTNEIFNRSELPPLLWAVSRELRNVPTNFRFWAIIGNSLISPVFTVLSRPNFVGCSGGLVPPSV